MHDKIAVDTNILLDFPEIFDDFKDKIINIHSIVVEEIDNIIHKSLDEEKKYKARQARNAIIKAKNKVYSFHNPSFSLPLGWDYDKNDNNILRVCKDLDWTIYTNDLLMQIKAEQIDVDYKKYSKNNSDTLYSGIKYIEIKDEDECIEDIINRINLSELIENQYVCIGIWEYNEEFEQNQFKLEKAFRYTKGYLDAVKSPRLGDKLNDCFRSNIEQRLIYDAINCDDIDILIVHGEAGTGKDFSVLSNCLNNVNQPSKNKRGNYKAKSMLYTRTTVESGVKQGFLPGDALEKSSPYFQPARQNLNKILEIIGLNDDYEKLIKDNKYIEFPLAYMRGCTYENCYLILDESANSSIDELKMFISRAGENSKVIILGSINQIDSKGCSNTNNGLYELINAYKGQKNCAVIELRNQQRSYLARQADQLLK